MWWSRRSLTVVLVTIGLVSTLTLWWHAAFASDSEPGTVSTITGAGDLDDPAFAADARIPFAQSLAITPEGDLLLSDVRLCTIRKISGVNITTVAGTLGSCGYSGDGGPATNAQLSGRAGLAVDDDGNIYIADTYNCVIRRVDAATQIITHVVGNYDPCSGIILPEWPALAENGDLYFSQTCQVWRVSSGIASVVVGHANECEHGGDGGPASSGRLRFAQGLAFDNAGNLYIADSKACRIRMVSAGIITTAAGTGTCGYNGDGPALVTHLNRPFGLAVDADGGVLIAEYQGCLIRRLKGGQLTTAVGFE